MKMLKKHPVVFSVIIILIGIIIVLGFINYNNYIYAKRTINAIEKEDIPTLQKLMKYPFGNLNSKPRWWIVEVLSESNTATPLQAACKLGNVEIVKILLDNGANPNYIHWDKSRSLGSPLMCAAGSLSNNRLTVIKLLIEYGANVNFEDAAGNDVLTCAVYAGNGKKDTIEIIEYLEKNGLNIYKKYSQTKNSLLHKACETDNFLVIQYLIEQRRFDINETNADGDTALIYFVRFASKRQKNTALFLIEKGANLNAQNKDGKTAYDYAVERHPELVELLK